MSARTDILDEDGENKILRCFLLVYGGAPAVTIGRMRANLNSAGWNGFWPEWASSAHQDEHLTKAGAQLWIRHLLALEPAPTPPAPPEGILHHALQEQLAREKATQTEVKCSACQGNDADMPCAYPSSGRAGCLRDLRLSLMNLGVEKDVTTRPFELTVALGHWDESGRWQHNPELALTREEQRVRNEVNGHDCTNAKPWPWPDSRLPEQLDDDRDTAALLEREMRDAQSLASLLRKERERFEFLHSNNRDKDGWEWGVARVRINADGYVEYFWGVSDHADIDEARAAQQGEKGGAA